MFTRFPRFAAALVVGGLTIGAAAPALAQDETGEETTDEAADTQHVVNLKERCQQAIARRFDSLASTQARLDDNQAITEGHHSTLDAIIDSTESGLTQLSADIAAEDNRAELVQLCTDIATDYRVYLVVLPQTYLTNGADRVDMAASHGHELLASFDAAVEAAVAAGADVEDAVALRDQAVAHLGTAESSNSGVAAGALGVTPQSFNDGPGEVVLDTVRGALQSAHTELKAGFEDGKAAVEALREAIRDVEDSST